MKTNNQITSTVLMVVPNTFGFNEETFSTNDLQHPPLPNVDVCNEAMKEFSRMFWKLEPHVNVILMESRKDCPTPDALFPNNWMGTFGGKVVLFPMKNESRRLEIRPMELKRILEEAGFPVDFYPLMYFQCDNMPLEGTGSIVVARDRKVAFASSSERTNKLVFKEFCNKFGFKPVYFYSSNPQTCLPVYHTNVIMSIGSEFVVVCMEAVERACRGYLMHELKNLEKEIIQISFPQVKNLCGNILQLNTKDNERAIIVMSTTALRAFTDEQLFRLGEYGQIIDIDIPTIENVGGGGVRCCLAEIFLEPSDVKKEHSYKTATRNNGRQHPALL